MASYQKLELKEVVVEPQTESLISKVGLRRVYLYFASTFILFVNCMFSIKSYVSSKVLQTSLIELTGVHWLLWV